MADVKFCNDCVHSRGLDGCFLREGKSLIAARRECLGAWWDNRPSSRRTRIEVPASPPQPAFRDRQDFSTLPDRDLAREAERMADDFDRHRAKVPEVSGLLRALADRLLPF